MGGICASVYQQFWPRCGCEEDEQGAGCYGEGMPGVTSCPCVEDIEDPGLCTLGTEYYVLPIRACEGNCQ